MELAWVGKIDAFLTLIDVLDVLKACLTADVSIFQFFPMYALGVIGDFLTVFIEKTNILRDFN